jgi:hypothetical protein
MKYIALALFMASILPSYAQAQLVITKVMANPVGSNAGRQWIEISNTGTTSVDLGAKNIRLYTTSGNHLIKANTGSDTMLLPNSIGVIAENPMSFLFDYPDYAGKLFKSSFTLPQAGLVGIVQTDGTVLVRKSYVAPPTPAKPASVSKSTTKRATTRTTSSSKSQLKSSNKKSYDSTGTLAPAAASDDAAAGAVFTLPALLVPAEPYLATTWFAGFLALIIFSGFSLIVIQRHYYV